MAEPTGNLVARIGAGFLGALAWAGGLALLLGHALRWALAGLFLPKVKFRWSALCDQMVRVGIRSLGVVMLVQTFVGVILALQITPSLAKYGSAGQVSVIIGIGGFRMMGPIITAVVLSGFAGASIAAELGTMVVAEEIEAMEATALNPVRFLVVPRVFATTVMMVLLSVVADLMIAAGGYLTAWWVLTSDVYVGYWDRMRDGLAYRDFFTGLAQAGVFGLLISLIACREGLRVSGGAEGVGKATTRTVVYSIVSIIAASCACTMIFYRLKW